MNKLSYKIIGSISQIEQSAWTAVFADMAEGYAFYKTLEESNLQEFSFLYVLIYENETLVLIAPIFISDFNLDIVVEGFSKRIIHNLRKFFPQFLIFKTLFCGSPFGEHGVIGISPSAHSPNLLKKLTQILTTIGKEKNISLIMFKDFLQKDLSTLSLLTPEKFFVADSFPCIVVNLPFSSMEEYLASLSKNTRKDLRRKLKETSNIEVKVVNQIESVIDEIYQLYLNTYNAGEVKFEKLTKEFFLNISRNMSSTTRFFLYYVEGKLCAFNLCLLHQDTLIDKFIGFDYALARKYHLYFYSWYYNVEWCLKNSVRHYQVGQTDYQPKLKLGGKAIPLYVFLKHRNRLINCILKLLAKVLVPSHG